MRSLSMKPRTRVLAVRSWSLLARSSWINELIVSIKLYVIENKRGKMQEKVKKSCILCLICYTATIEQALSVNG